MKMAILALDCATKTGWAIIRDGRVYESGVQDFSKRRGESNGAMFLRFRTWLEIMVGGGIDFVAYEQSHHRGGAATEIGVNLTGRVQEACANHEIDYAAVHTATLKKWACGHGKASKEQMMARAVAYLGRAPEDDNEADAVLLGMWAAENYGG
jgi:Holliday junction resolvasome RuvABC endonuclease subunit